MRRKLLLNSIIGNVLKLKVWFYLLLNIPPRKSSKCANDVVVSLTSYGRRVSKSTPYTIFSIFRQNVVPEIVTLWLDENQWNDENLPFALQRMKKWGMVDVFYCKDVGSYTKLIPALRRYPNKSIIIIDDDIYYSSDLLMCLWTTHLTSPQNIIALSHGEYNYEKGNIYTFPLGTGGVLYPPNSLHEIVFDEKLRTTICPYFDDLWFYTMALLKGTGFCFLVKCNINYYYVDLFYQWSHKGSRLYEMVRDKNKETLWKLLCYFGLQ